jgi:LacI family transcriptional regulator
MAPVTMQQIADELGISRQTVSSVINHNARERRISSATISRVRHYMEERGYVPSRQATSLKNGKQDNLGILYCESLYSHLIEAFNKITALYHSRPGVMEAMIVSRTRLVQGVQELLARGVSTLIWLQTIRSQEEFADPLIHNYLANFKKVIIYNYRFTPLDNSRELIEKGYYVVGVDRTRGFERLAGFLKSLGHRRVALPDRNATEQPGNDERYKALNGAGLEVCHTLLPGTPHLRPQECGRPFARGVIQAMRARRVTAACLYDDEQAGFMMEELLKQGVEIPRDLTVTGYDNMPFSAILKVPLTNLSVPVDDMVRQVGLLQQNGGKRKRYCFDLDLVKRSSHGPAAKRQ